MGGPPKVPLVNDVLNSKRAHVFDPRTTSRGFDGKIEAMPGTV